MKVCSKCHIEKDESEFKPKRCRCNGCTKIYMREHRLKNIDVRKKKEAEYRARNRGKIKEYKQKNREHLNEQRREWGKKNTDRVLASAMAYYNDNKDVVNQKRKGKYIDRKKAYMEKWKGDIADGYARDILIRQGYTGEQIDNIPVLLAIKKIEVAAFRIKKQNRK